MSSSIVLSSSAGKTLVNRSSHEPRWQMGGRASAERPRAATLANLFAYVSQEDLRA
ncbi:hypothetical protein LJR034_008514 [Caballeronia sp. LjRoot34]|uniref:hypothetical protein n=1 Tax=Caballeronia sp. LjRoot34 TaxID=3342325 RepID=UPI003ED14AFA